MHARRTELAARYDLALRELPVVLPPQAEPGDVHAWHLFVLRLRSDAPIQRDAFIQGMADLGIGCSVHYIPLHRHPYWRDTYGLRTEQFPAAEQYFRSTVSIPLFSRMSDAECDRVIEAVRSLLTP